MAEERIYIGKINWQEPTGFCPVPMGECNSFCEDCQGGMTRQEAIERMAKGMFIANWQGRYSWDNTDYAAKKHFIVWAEAALNALLEAVTNCNQ